MKDFNLTEHEHQYYKDFTMTLPETQGACTQVKRGWSVVYVGLESA